MGRDRRSKNPITLPWERRGALFRGLLAGRRWKVILLGLALAGGLGLVVRSADHRQNVRKTRASILEVKRAIAAFQADMGRCPNNLHELIHPPPGNGQRYLEEVPLDGWGHTLWVRCPGRYDPGAADVISAGASGSFLVDDNVQ